MQRSLRIFITGCAGAGLVAALMAQAPDAAKAAALRTRAAAASAAAQSALADAQELELEAGTIAGRPGEAGAAAFAQERAKQLRQNAATLEATANQLRTQITALEVPPPPPPSGGDAPPSPAAPGGATAAPATPGLSWGAWDQVASCSGVDVHFSMAFNSDGGQRVRIRFLNSNADPVSISYKPTYQGASGQKVPSSEGVLKIGPHETGNDSGDLIPFTIAKYGISFTVALGELTKTCPLILKPAPKS